MKIDVPAVIEVRGRWSDRSELGMGWGRGGWGRGVGVREWGGGGVEEDSSVW